MRFDALRIRRMFEEYRAANYDSKNFAVRRFRSFKSVDGAMSLSPQYVILLFACRRRAFIRLSLLTAMMRDLVIGNQPYSGPGSTIHAEGRKNYLTAFHYAVQCNNAKAVEFFLKKRRPAPGVEVSVEALVNAPLVQDVDPDLGIERCGWTPLMTAAYLGHKNMVETLIWHGADVFRQGEMRRGVGLRDVGGRHYTMVRRVGIGKKREVDAIGLAKQAGHADILALLLKEAACQQKAATDIQRMVRGVGVRGSLVKLRDASTGADVELSAARLWQKPKAIQVSVGTQTEELQASSGLTR